MKFTEYFNIDRLLGAFEPAAVFLVILLTGLVIRKLLMMQLSKWAKSARTSVADIIIKAISKPFVIWCIMLAIYIVLDASRLPQANIYVAGKVLMVLGILSVTLVLANISSAAIKLYSGKQETILPVTTLTQNIARIGIFGTGILIILNSLGISITPIP